MFVERSATLCELGSRDASDAMSDPLLNAEAMAVDARMEDESTLKKGVTDYSALEAQLVELKEVAKVRHVPHMEPRDTVWPAWPSPGPNPIQTRGRDAGDPWLSAAPRTLLRWDRVHADVNRKHDVSPLTRVFSRSVTDGPGG
jgi:hypothetical protein